MAVTKKIKRGRLSDKDGLNEEEIEEPKEEGGDEGDDDGVVAIPKKKGDDDDLEDDDLDPGIDEDIDEVEDVSLYDDEKYIE